MKIIVAGASGFVGTRLVQVLEQQGYEVLQLTRDLRKAGGKVFLWNPDKREVPLQLFAGTDAVINLAGENVAAGRWTSERKRRILFSRVNATRTLVRAMEQQAIPPQTFINASAIGYYGTNEQGSVTEESSSGRGFLAEVCREWESTAAEASHVHIRTVMLRIGLVLSPAGGALKRMLLPFKLGVGGRVGSGKQQMSWIALDDLVAIIQFILEHKEIVGPVNAVSPYPVSNQEFTRILGRVLHRPTVFPLPAFLVSLLFGQMGDELLLKGCRVSPSRLQEHGYRYLHPDLEDALRSMLN